jgi:hypothetical protein
MLELGTSYTEDIRIQNTVRIKVIRVVCPHKNNAYNTHRMKGIRIKI